MQTRSVLKNVVIMSAVVLISTGCGGGSSGGADSSFNLSGDWSGQIVTEEATRPINMTINQSESDSADAVVSLSGTLNGGGSSLPITGTTNGADVSIQFPFASANATGTMTGSLTDENAMSGNYSDTTGDSGTWSLLR